jgi:hypothetical protein
MEGMANPLRAAEVGRGENKKGPRTESPGMTPEEIEKVLAKMLFTSIARQEKILKRKPRSSSA